MVDLVVVSAVVLSSGVLFAQATPTATFKAHYEASKRKDPAAIKKTLSKNDLKELVQAPMPLDSLLLSAFSDMPPTLPESRNERVTGNTATLEVYSAKNKEWETMHFVKEDGEWKITTI